MVDPIFNFQEIFMIFMKNFLIIYFTFKFFQFVSFFLSEFLYSGTELDPYEQLRKQQEKYERIERREAAAKKRIRTPVFTRGVARNTVARNTRAACRRRRNKATT